MVGVVATPAVVSSSALRPDTASLTLRAVEAAVVLLLVPLVAGAAGPLAMAAARQLAPSKS